MTLHKEYWELSQSGKWKCKESVLKVTVTFNKDGVNWATSRRVPKGYRVSVVPVERSNREGGIVMESFGAFTGFNDTLIETDRQSKKRLQQAIDTLQERKDGYIRWFMETTDSI